MVEYIVKSQLNQSQSNLVDAFKLECSASDIKQNKEAKRLARYINKHGKRTDRICNMISKLCK
ncbi:MAG: hypothetical protein K0R54_2775 [Clostridiaceae bacterium]|jgi:hypothetical protein|nr:hypothetical protein [Clostridiaceae bacterium]MDF2950493.1 hypothetical protein [Anaerocolumna sp.]